MTTAANRAGHHGDLHDAAIAKLKLQFAIALQGTSTPEQGIGRGKMATLVAAHGPAIRVMAAIKHAVDPHNIMKPGKIFNLAEMPPFN
ncbi:FAD-linked oxidase C-terminal domain-containing protein [Rhizobium sp. No.120]